MKKRKVSVVKFLLAPLVILIGVLGYYQFLYKSKRVDSGIVQLNKMFSGFGHVVTSARFTPDDSLVVASSADSTIRFWDKNSGQLVKEFKQPVGVSYMDISHDGKFIVFGAYDSKVRIIERTMVPLSEPLQVIRVQSGQLHLVRTIQKLRAQVTMRQ